jgi:hypothetical protein
MAFEDFGHHPKWPKVADAVIEALLGLDRGMVVCSNSADNSISPKAG